MNPVRSSIAALIFTTGSLLLAGCGAMPSSAISSTATGQAIHGRVHGGNQAVVGAHVYLFAAGISGYGGPSVSLLRPSAPGVYTDSLGSYVLSDASSNFNISGTYNCTPGQQVYLLATGGNPGLAPGLTNPSLALLSALGQCPSEGNLANTVPVININEVSTVAAAYALGGFMTDATHLSSSSTDLAATGIANAFINVNLLMNTASGSALSQTPLGSGSAPQATVNSLANILTACVNSPGTSTSCSTLFSNAKAPDGSTPHDTVTAILNIAHNPAASVGPLFALSTANPPFQPALTAAPNDWTVAVTTYADYMAGPYYPAIDAAGNVWVPGYANNTVTQFNSYGAELSQPSNGFKAATLNQPFAIAIDSAQNPWVANYAFNGTADVSKLSPNGSDLGGTACGNNCTGVAIDTNQDIWVGGSSSATAIFHSTLPLGQFSITAAGAGLAIDSTSRAWIVGLHNKLYRLTLPQTVDSFTTNVPAATSDLNMIAVDSNDNIWFTSGKNNAIGRTDKDGKSIAPGGGYKGGGLNFPAQLAIDGSNRVWVANRDGNSISAFNNDGTAITPATGYQPSGQTAIDPTLIGRTGLRSPHGIAIDGSGNVWVTNFTGNSVTTFFGLATPVITPMSPTTHGQRP
jgi:hypothetical protein